jgi:hypothetical protein
MLALPFTRDEFFSVFARYNTEIWSAPVIAIVLGLVAVAALWLRPAYGRAIVLIVLALFWVWTGVVYHILFFANINPLAFAFGALFVVEGFLLSAHAFGRSTLEFSLDAPNRAWGWALIFYAGIAYPLLLVLSGHAWPAMPMFGVTPCPLVIFTFGIFLFARGGAPWRVLAIPLAWSIIGGSAALLLGVAPDWALPIAAILTVALTARARRPHRPPTARSV